VTSQSWTAESTPLVLVGPTAIGKTAVAIELAERCGGEIVNADSMQVYIGMDIGAAKPDADDRGRAAFHLLDVVRPDEAFSVSEWKRRSELAISAILSRGRLPIVCGGTGLYIRALVDDWSLALTPAAPEIRQELQQLATQHGSAFLHDRLTVIDPETAARLHPNDTVRIIRALEVHRVTGCTISQVQSQNRAERRLRPFVQIGLTMPRPQIYSRIERRVDKMIEMGLEQEVATLMEQGYSPALSPMRSLGYKEMCAFHCGDMDMKTAIETIKLNTRRFSKRQQTWFGADPRIDWIDVSALNSATVADQICRSLANSRRLSQCTNESHPYPGAPG
jgi:tRNA dimethylallyltransferase